MKKTNRIKQKLQKATLLSVQATPKFDTSKDEK